MEEFGLVIARKSDPKMALAKEICRNKMALARDICRNGRFRGNAEKKQMNSDRGLEDEVFDDVEFGDNRIAGNKFAGNQMAHYVVSQDYLQDVSNNNVEDKVVDQLAEGKSIVIVNDDGGFVIVNDFGNVNNGKVNSIVNNGIVNKSSVKHWNRSFR